MNVDANRICERILDSKFTLGLIGALAALVIIGLFSLPILGHADLLYQIIAAAVGGATGSAGGGYLRSKGR